LMQKVNVKADDPLTLTITLDGILGVDMATVAGRERVRGQMELKVEKTINDFFESVTVLE
jgi:hypothetical protein